MISIIIPCYNDAKVLPRAVASALAQTYPDFEVIVVDDGSDVPIGIKADGPVRVIRHEHNRGLSAALNTGIRNSQGDRFVILAADDELRKDHLTLTSRVDADVISVDMSVGGQQIRAKPGSLDELMQGNCHSYAALIKKWVWRATGGFKECMNPSWEDYEFFLNAAKVGAQWGHVGKPLHIYHRNPVGRDAKSQGKDSLLWGKLKGFHQDLYGLGAGVVTFVVPCYNHEQFLLGAVQSALDQEYPHVRVVVVDDGSPGDVPEALRDVVDDRLVVLRQPNGHLSSARNTGIYYALQEFGSEYLVMLDADDEADPLFIEATMGALQGQEYVYTDVRFIGDAYHAVAMENYDCGTLVTKHLHPCTFLMPSRMWEDVVRARGYGYDEEMKRGWEDWEFALAAVESGWCGHRLPGEYFYYRYHKNGSMRTKAGEIKGELVGYIRDKHPWMMDKTQVVDMCKTCGGGGGRFSAAAVRGGMGVMFVPGVGDVVPTDILMVRYTGATTSIMTKQGAGGKLYRYSAVQHKGPNGAGPNLTVRAVDIHLFRGPFIISRIDQQVAAQTAPPPSPRAQRRVEVIEVPKPAPAPPPQAREVPVAPPVPQPRKLDEVPVEQALKMTDAGTEFEPEDFTEIKGIGPEGQKKLVQAGFTVYDDIGNANLVELASILNVSDKQASKVRDAARQLITELGDLE